MCTQKISLRITRSRNFENRFTFAKVIIKHQGAWFFLEHGVYWQDQEIIYDFRAQLQGTGSRSDVFRHE